MSSQRGRVAAKRYLVNSLLLALSVLYLPFPSFGQEVEKPLRQYLSWALLQALPSPVLYDDSGGSESTARAGLRWQVIPVNYSFSANRFVPNIQFFMVNPVRRFAGSMELFLQPEVVCSNFNHTRLKSFWISTGFRVVFPVINYGELLSGSLGIKYNFQKIQEEASYNKIGLEAGLYLYGMLGIQVNINLLRSQRYSLGLYLKYY